MSSLNPIFTPETDSTFVLDCTNAELAEKNGLKFIVKDWDLIGSNDALGTVEVAPPALTTCSGKTMEFMIVPPPGREEEDAGYVLIRCRDVTKEDERAVAKKKIKKNMFDTTTEIAARAFWPSLPDPLPEPAKPKQSTVDVAEEVARESGDMSESSMDSREAVKPKAGEEMHLKIEIVSCRGLLVADKTTSGRCIERRTLFGCGLV